jgi:hypothetical protein
MQEFFTFDGSVLRTNIAMSATGSTLYVVGSVVSLKAAGLWPALSEYMHGTREGAVLH